MFKPQQRPLDCAVTAQIAHGKYADRYARWVRIRVRTGGGFALRFAPSNANQMRTRPVVSRVLQPSQELLICSTGSE